MVLYGVIANTSIGQLFLGGIVSGFLCAGALMVMVWCGWPRSATTRAIRRTGAAKS